MKRRSSTGQSGYWVLAQPFGRVCLKVVKSKRSMIILAERSSLCRARTSTIGFLKGIRSSFQRAQFWRCSRRRSQIKRRRTETDHGESLASLSGRVTQMLAHELRRVQIVIFADQRVIAGRLRGSLSSRNCRCSSTSCSLALGRRNCAFGLALRAAPADPTENVSQKYLSSFTIE